jgi:hypothetical protein
VAQRDIPSDVMAFLHERLAGLDELEVLLLVRSDASRGWTATEVAQRLGLPGSSGDGALEKLCAAELLVVDGGGGGAERLYVYRPTAPGLDGVVAALAEVYAERRLEVMRILSDSALERIRSAAARTFADAFVIGKRRKDG